MNIFYQCVSAVIAEGNRVGQALPKNVCKIDNSIDINFDLPVNRIAFLYKFGTFRIHFFKKCFSEFVSDCPEALSVLERMLSSKLVCSLSNGPGTDIIGLQLALKELGKTFNKNTFFKIISKYGSWRNTMNILIDTKPSQFDIIGSFKLLQCNIVESLSSKAENCLKSADIVLIDHAFASPNAQKIKILDTLKILLQILKPGAYLIFIDTKKNMSYFELLNSYGTYIYGPKEVQVDNLPYSKEIAEQIGGEPVCCGKAYFGVWQKNIKTDNIMANSMSVVNVIPAAGIFKENMNCDKSIKPNMHRSIENVSTTMREQLKNITIDNTLLVNIIPAIENLGDITSNKSNTTLTQHTPLKNLIPAMQNFRDSTSCESNITSQLNSSSGNLSASMTKTKPFLYDTSQGKSASGSFTSKTKSTADRNATPSTAENATIRENTETFDRVAGCTEDMKTLLQSLNSLVAKLENFISSETISQNLNSLKYGNHGSASDNRCSNYHGCWLHKRCCYLSCGSTEHFCTKVKGSCNCHALSDAC